MATWRKAVGLGLAVLLGMFPVFARVDTETHESADRIKYNQDYQVLLPNGDVCTDEELISADGELAWYLVALLDAGIGGASALGIAMLGGDQLTPGQMAGIGAIGAGAGLILAIMHHVIGDDSDGGE